MKGNDSKGLGPGIPTARWGEESRWLGRVIDFTLRNAEASQRRIADVGCGYGRYVDELGLAFPATQIVGVDMNRDHIKDAMDNSKEPNAFFLVADAENLPFKGGSFTLVLCGEVLEHLRSDRKALLEIHRVLDYGGTVIVTVPSRIFPFETHSIRIGKRELPSWVPFLPWFPERLRALFQTARVYSDRHLIHILSELGFSIGDVSFSLPDFTKIPDERLRSTLRRIVGLLAFPPLRRLLAPHILVSATKVERD